MGRGVASQGPLFDEEEAPVESEAGEAVVLTPTDVCETLEHFPERVTTTILDPWYNKGVGGTRDDYMPWLAATVALAARVSDHVFVWGFPEILYPLAGMAPEGFKLDAWLTWYYKNCPSVIRGWRSAQMTCLHFRRDGAKLYPEHFLNAVQLERKAAGKLRYMPGPPNVIEASLNIGFVGKKEQTGHPSQKPEAVYRPLIEMTTTFGDVVLDPMCGSGTTGTVCVASGRRAILCDASDAYTAIVERRLGITRKEPRYDVRKFLSAARSAVRCVPEHSAATSSARK